MRAPGATRGGIAREQRTVLFGGARRRRPVAPGAAILTLVLAAALAVLVVRPALARPVLDPVPAPSPAPAPTVAPALPPVVLPGGYRAVRWHHSRALGLPFRRGRLVRGVQLPAEGLDWFTYDWQLGVSPNRGFRRYGTDALVRMIVSVLAEYRYADPLAPRVGIADLSRTHGGSFGERYGGLGHASHQNGLDVDVLYPRLDGREAHAGDPAEVDRVRAQALVDGFVAAGARYVFVGRRIALRGPPRVVQAIPYHDDHLHVRIWPPGR